MNATAEDEQTIMVEEIIQEPPLLLNFLKYVDPTPPGICATDTWSTGPDEGSDWCDT